MIRAIRVWLNRKRAVKVDAEDLIDILGDRAWLEAHSRASANIGIDNSIAIHWWRVRDLIAARLEVRWMPDTATRWLERSEDS